jgi:hypothetical protein
VCKKILGFIAGPKKGADIRDHFEGAPLGWSRDTVDGALLVLLVGGFIKAEGESGQADPLKNLERKLISKITFKVESATVSTTQKVQARKLLMQLAPQVKPSEELSVIPEFLNKLEELAKKAGGEKPKPEQPDISVIDDLRLISGNEQILALYNLREELSKSIDEWTSLSKSIEKRWPSWEKLLKLIAFSKDSASANDTITEVEAINTDRLLLAEPDPIQPLINLVEASLKNDLITLKKQYSDEFSKRLSELEKHKSLRELEGNQKEEIFQQCEINNIPEFKLGCHEDLVKVLETHPIKIWKDRVDSLSKRFERAYEMAVKLTEPDTHAIELPKRTLKSENDIETWLAEVAKQLRAAIAKGPVVIR